MTTRAPTIEPRPTSWFWTAMAVATATACLPVVKVAHAAAPGAEERLRVSQGELRVAAGEEAAPAERRAAELFVTEVHRRTGIAVTLGNTTSTKYTLVTGTAKSNAAIRQYVRSHPDAATLETDGFHLATAPDNEGRLYVIGQSTSGMVAGIGKLLRLSRYADGDIEIPRLTFNDHPRMPVRGMYFATHFGNFYHVAPIEEVDRIIEELALWGANSLCVWFDMHHFKSLEDPAAQKHLARLKHFAETAHGVGMQFGLTFIANEGYASSPKELREHGCSGAYGVELCPSKPEGLALIGKWQTQVIEAFPQVDFIWMWPYDQGGCWCAQCQPWGANGFLRASEQLARLYHERFPRGQAWLSTWCFDVFLRTGGEYDGLLRYLREKKPAWLAGIISGKHQDVIEQQLLSRPSPERYPLTCFPEISMYKMGPWGGFGANPLPRFYGRLADNARGGIQGGWPYSEGIYEDINKFFWVQFYWNPDRTGDDVHSEYAEYYLRPEVAKDTLRLFHLLEDTHARANMGIQNLKQADEAWALAESINARLPEWTKTSWRWRLFHIRAAIDHVAKNNGYTSAKARAVLEPLRDELSRIYCRGNWVFPLPKIDPSNLAYEKPVTVSSTVPGRENSVQFLVDGAGTEHDPENFWAHDPAKEKTAWVCVDLGQSVPIHQVRLGFRNLGGQYAFIPESVGVAVSEDGKDFAVVLDSKEVPAEGAKYSNRPWVYKVGKTGRYLRINLGPSQRKQPTHAGTLELTEIQVLGKPRT